MKLASTDVTAVVTTDADDDDVTVFGRVDEIIVTHDSFVFIGDIQPDELDDGVSNTFAAVSSDIDEDAFEQRLGTSADDWSIEADGDRITVSATWDDM